MLASTIQFTNTPRPKRPTPHHQTPPPAPNGTEPRTTAPTTGQAGTEQGAGVAGRRPPPPKDTPAPAPPPHGSSNEGQACSLRTQQHADTHPAHPPPERPQRPHRKTGTTRRKKGDLSAMFPPMSNHPRRTRPGRRSPTPSSTPQPREHAAGRRPPLQGAGAVKLLRKEVIQPHLPVRLPCYDFVPIASPTFDHSLP